MTTFRIYTEDVNREQVLAETTALFPSFNYGTITGYWQGQGEGSLVLEIVGDARKLAKHVKALATRIKIINHQEAVLITKTPVESQLV